MKHLLTFALISFSLLSYSQEITDFEWFGRDYEGEWYLGLGFTGMNFSNNKAPFPDEHKSNANSIRWGMQYINYSVGEPRVYYQYKLLEYILPIAIDEISTGNSTNTQQQSFITSGFLGWWSVLWNLNEPEKYQFAVGFNLNDHILSTNYLTGKQEPQGYYLTAGPSASFTYSINSLLMVEYLSTLSIPLLKSEEKDISNKVDYKNPYFLNNKIELITSKGLFGGLELSNIINRGNLPNNTKMTQWYIGFRFPL